MGLYQKNQIMKHRKEQQLLLKDLLETEELDSCAHSGLELALENVEDGNADTYALYHLDNLCYDVFQRIPSVKEDRTLFRFCDLKAEGENKGKKWEGDQCYAFNDIKEGKLTFGTPQRFNDPMDPLIKAWVEWRKIHYEDKFDKALYQLIYETLGKIRISCLVDPLRDEVTLKKNVEGIDKCSPLMWAHYADNHKGICIKYRIKPTNQIDDDNLIVRLFEVNYDKPFPLDGNIPLMDSLCVKGNCWRYEKETRLIMYSREDVDDHHSLSGYEIESVYMGCRIEHKKRNYLKNLLRNTNIKLYQMSFSTNDISQIKAHLVE